MRTSLMHDHPNAGLAAPVEAARQAIWRLFEEGYVDEDMATAGLLAVDLGTRRAENRAAARVAAGAPHRADGRRHGGRRTRRAHIV
jgi:hypothetical protein